MSNGGALKKGRKARASRKEQGSAADGQKNRKMVKQVAKSRRAAAKPAATEPVNSSQGTGADLGPAAPPAASSTTENLFKCRDCEKETADDLARRGDETTSDEETTEQEERHAVSALCPSLTSWLSSFGAVPPQDTTVYDAIMDNDLSGLSISDTTSAGGHCGDVTPAAPVQSVSINNNVTTMGACTAAATAAARGVMSMATPFAALAAASASVIMRPSSNATFAGKVIDKAVDVALLPAGLVLATLHTPSPTLTPAQPAEVLIEDECIDVQAEDCAPVHGVDCAFTPSITIRKTPAVTSASDSLSLASPFNASTDADADTTIDVDLDFMKTVTTAAASTLWSLASPVIRIAGKVLDKGLDMALSAVELVSLHLPEPCPGPAPEAPLKDTKMTSTLAIQCFCNPSHRSSGPIIVC